MHIVSNYIWEKATDGGANPISLALQQVKLRGREICLFCVCNSPERDLSGRVTEQLVEWFHGRCLPVCESRTLPLPGELLRPELWEIGRGLPEQATGVTEDILSCTGLLLLGNRFYLFGMGAGEAWMANRRYNRPQLKKLPLPLTGRIQKGVGILLCTSGFIENLETKEVCQILSGEGQWQEERIGRRLRELRREEQNRGNTGPAGGIYLQVM